MRISLNMIYIVFFLSFSFFFSPLLGYLFVLQYRENPMQVLTLVQKLTGYVAVECLSSEAKKEMEDILEHASDIPKAPWDEGVCKVCGVDKDDDNVLLCDKCDSGYHTYCLNPPLARIPEGNWYCPSCIPGHRIAQSASQIPPFVCQYPKRKRQGELTRGVLETLAHLGTTMEVKDYWEYSVEEVCLWISPIPNFMALGSIRF